MEKEELVRDINELIIKMGKYYKVSDKNNIAFFDYLKNCEKALLDLLNEFDEKCEKINKNVPFDNIFNYKWDYKYRDRDYKELVKDFKRLENKYKNVCDDLEEAKDKFQDLLTEFKEQEKIKGE